jgi:hypothetical protein
MRARRLTRPSLKSSRFSKPELIIFVLVFAAIGGYIIYKSFAANSGGAQLSALYALEDAVPAGSSSVTVSTPSALASQAANPTARIVNVSAGTYPGQVEFSARPSQVTKFVFAPGVKFTGGACCNGTSGPVVAFYVTGSNLVLWGPADVNNPNYDGIRVENASNIVIGGIKSHNNGLQGILVQNSGGSNPTNIWLDGVESYTNATAAAATAIGSGFQPCSGGQTVPNCDYYKAGAHALYWGPGTTGGGVVNSYFHDQNNGYCIEVQNAVSGSIFAFDTLTRCLSQSDGFHDKGSGYFSYSNSNETYVGNVIDGTALAGIAWCSAAGSGMGNVFWNNPNDTLNECSGPLTISDSHHIDPKLDATDRPLAGSPIVDIDSAYAANYLPRTDFTGAARSTADAGAFAVGGSGTPVATASLSANPTSITAGGSSTLTWSSTNAASCTAGGAWSGTKATSSSQSVSPTATSTYTMTCTGAGGTSSPSSATVTVASSNGTITMGEANVLTSPDTNNGNLLISQSAVLSQPATIQSLSFYVTNAAGLLRLGVYDATGPAGGPGNLKAQTPEITPQTGWNTYNVISPVLLPAGTYWLAYLPSDSNLAFVNTQNATSSAKFYSYTYGPLPATFSTTPQSDPSHWSFYATLNTNTSGGGASIGDFNNDSHVNALDLSTLLSHYGGAGTSSTGDCNGDGQVNAIDLSTVLSHYGT